MKTPPQSPEDEARTTDDKQRGLAEIERPADDPQTRPALEPEVSLAERRIPEDT